MKEHRHALRHSIVIERICPLGVITFKKLEWSDFLARLIDISRDGAGIESESVMEPGFVFFKDRLAGNKSGVLMWSRRDGNRFRGGIRFLPLTPDQELDLCGDLSRYASYKPVRSPEEMIDALMRTLADIGQKHLKDS